MNTLAGPDRMGQFGIFGIARLGVQHGLNLVYPNTRGIDHTTGFDAALLAGLCVLAGQAFDAARRILRQKACDGHVVQHERPMRCCCSRQGQG